MTHNMLLLFFYLCALTAAALAVYAKPLGARFCPQHPKLGRVGVLLVAVCVFSVYAFFRIIRPDLLWVPLEHRTILIDNQSFEVEVAKSEPSKERGLMGRTILPDNQGMLFVWKAPGHQTFWMKNTLIPLDILFFDTKGVLVGLSSETPICMMDPCPNYDGGAKEDSQIVVELASGVADKHGFKVGQTRLKIEPKTTP